MRDQTGNSNLDAKISAASADLRSNGKAVKGKLSGNEEAGL